MEDRRTAGLYLEMTDWTARTLHARRGCRWSRPPPGVTRATWWHNVQPRPRRPAPRARRVRHCSASTRSTTRSAPPSRADGVTGHHFRRTPGPARVAHRPPDDRPLARAHLAQGSRSRRRRCATGPTSCTSATSPRSRCPGYTMITPYENATGGDPRFMHFYEMDTDDPETAFKSMTPLVMRAHRRAGHRRVQALGVRTRAAHHVREHVRAGSASAPA